MSSVGTPKLSHPFACVKRSSNVGMYNDPAVHRPRSARSADAVRCSRELYSAFLPQASLPDYFAVITAAGDFITVVPPMPAASRFAISTLANEVAQKARKTDAEPAAPSVGMATIKSSVSCHPIRVHGLSTACITTQRLSGRDRHEVPTRSAAAAS
jgi:hypothetical protein